MDRVQCANRRKERNLLGAIRVEDSGVCLRPNHGPFQRFWLDLWLHGSLNFELVYF